MVNELNDIAASTIATLAETQKEQCEIWGRGRVAGGALLAHRERTELEQQQEAAMVRLQEAKHAVLEALTGDSERLAEAKVRYREAEEGCKEVWLVDPPSAHAAVHASPPRDDESSTRTDRVVFTSSQISQEPKPLARTVASATPCVSDLGIDPLPLSDEDLARLYAELTDGGLAPLTWETLCCVYQQHDPCGRRPSDTALAGVLRRHGKRLEPDDIIPFDAFCVVVLSMHKLA